MSGWRRMEWRHEKQTEETIPEQADSEKERTGLIFLRGEPGGPARVREAVADMQEAGVEVEYQGVIL